MTYFKLLLLISSISIANISTAQDEEDDNLVKNPGFEIVDKKLKREGQIDKAEGWLSPTPESADVFTAEKSGLPVSIPNNVYGTEDALEGQHYAGFIAYSYGNKVARTYLTSELESQLEKDALYCITFHVSLSDLSKYACNNLSMLLTKKVPFKSEKEDIVLERSSDIESLVFHPANKVFDARYNWEPVCGVYTANGKEKHLVIGNFKDNRETKYDKLKKHGDIRGAQKAYAYYYIDNVSVKKISEPNECDCEIKHSDVPQRTTVIYRKTVSAAGDLTLEEKIENSTVYFDLLKANIDPSMIGDLNNLALILQQTPDLKLEVRGHIDNEEKTKASLDANYQDLDAKRINTVIEFLTDKGVSADRFVKKSMQASQIVDSDETELAKAKNRRVEFIIIE